MNRKGVNMVGALIGLVVGLMLLSLIGGFSLPWAKESQESFFEFASCSNGVIDGVCEISCAEGYQASTPKCPGSKKCCVPQNVPDSEHKNRVLFVEFVTALEYCYSNAEQVGCDAAEDRVYELIPRDSDNTLTFERSGGEVFVMYFEGQNKVFDTRVKAPFCIDQEWVADWHEDNNALVLNFGNNYQYYGLDSKDKQEFTGFSVEGPGFFEEGETEICFK